MLNFVDVCRERYYDAERLYKHEIIEEVLTLIKSNGGQFLERINSYWNPVPHQMAYRKVGHAFRSNTRKNAMEKKRRSTCSSIDHYQAKAEKEAVSQQVARQQQQQQQLFQNMNGNNNQFVRHPFFVDGGHNPLYHNHYRRYRHRGINLVSMANAMNDDSRGAATSMQQQSTSLQGMALAGVLPITMARATASATATSESMAMRDIYCQAAVTATLASGRGGGGGTTGMNNTMMKQRERELLEEQIILKNRIVQFLLINNNGGGNSGSLSRTSSTSSTASAVDRTMLSSGGFCSAGGGGDQFSHSYNRIRFG
jgi:hypothetical protein